MNGFLGKGTLYWDELSVNGVRSGLALSGNCRKFAIKTDSDLKELSSKGRDNYAQTIESVAVPKSSSISVIIDSFDKNTYKQAFMGSQSDITINSGTVSNASLTTLAIGKFVDIGHRNISNFTATFSETVPATATDWQASHAYSINDIISDVSDLGGHAYKCTTAGTSGALSTVSTTISILPIDGTSVTTGTAVFLDRGLLGATVASRVLPAQGLLDIYAQPQTFKVGELFRPPANHALATSVMRCTIAGTTGADADDFPTLGNTVEMGACSFKNIGVQGATITNDVLPSTAPAFQTSTAYRIGAFISNDGHIYECTTAGTSGTVTTQTTTNSIFTITGANVTTGTAVFRDMGAFGATVATALTTADYQLNARLGWITPLTAASASKTLTVSYSHTASSSSKILGGTNTIIKAMLVLDGVNMTTGSDCVVRAWEVTLTPTKEFDFLGSDFESLEFQGKMSIPDDKTSAFEVEYFG